MASNGSGATTTGAGDNTFATESKGKGKAAASEIPQDTPMGEDAEDDDDDDEEEEAEEVRASAWINHKHPETIRAEANAQVTGGRAYVYRNEGLTTNL
jgi:hypothetical protein